MDTTILKNFAQAARRQLREQVAARMEQVLRGDSVETREKRAAIAELREQIASASKAAVVDRVAYTWFNRFCALRFMDANHYTRVGIVSPVPGFTQPEVLQEAKQGVIDESFKVDRQVVFDLLNGRSPSADPQGEAYRLLLVGACNAYHARMPFLFQPIADYTELLMPDDLLSEQSVLQGARQALTEEACRDVEVIGWLYQFYISERKDEVIGSKEKIRPEDIPAATQLFTPHWIVRYLVENSLGRLWMLNHPESKLVEQMDYYIRPVEAETDFLEVDSPEAIKVCDPACGSGHMLTYAFDLLYAIYAEQGYDPLRIPSLILEKNLYGIEIDERAGDLAAFALTMKARARDRRFFSRGVQPNVLVLEDVEFSDRELEAYMQAVGRDLFTVKLKDTLKQFEQAKNFGSLIRPQLKDVAYVRSRLAERGIPGDLLLHSTHRKVEQVLKQAETLSPRYQVVVANPPYMGSGGMNQELKAFAKDLYPDSKSDLFAMFIERNLELACSHGYIGMITMHSWMFLSSYEKLRDHLLTNESIVSMAHLGARAFDTIGGEVVSTTAFILQHQGNQNFVGIYLRLVDGDNEAEKSEMLRENRPGSGDSLPSLCFRVSAADVKKIPGSPIAYWISYKLRNIFVNNSSVSEFFFSDGLTKTGDNDKYLRYHWEVNRDNAQNPEKYRVCVKGGEAREYFGNIDTLIDWTQKAREHYRNDKVARITPEYLWNSKGISWTKISSKGPTFRWFGDGMIAETGGPAIYLKKNLDPQVLWLGLGFLTSKVAWNVLSAVNPTLNFQTSDVLTLPFCQTVSERAISLTYKAFSLTKGDWNNFETAFDFMELPLLRTQGKCEALPKSYSTLLEKCKDIIYEVKRLKSNINELFIDAFNLQSEISPVVPLSEVTLLCNPHYRYPNTSRKSYTDEERSNLFLSDLIKEFISYAVGCMFGRYSLDMPGLVLANQGETAADYYAQIPQPSFPPDEDNVIPILDAGWFSDDITERFKRFLRVTFGDEHYEENLDFIENAIGRDVRSYFIKDFYDEHIKMYKKRPIYWLFSSPKGSFNALIYMHRYRPDTVSVVLNNYLREYMRKLNAHKAHLEQVSIRSAASPAEKTKALKEIAELNKVLAELKEYEDEVLYPLATQQIQIDLDDGVKVNYNKFGAALKTVKGLSD